MKGGQLLKVGQRAPQFSLKDRTGVVHSLKAAKGKRCVVYFYPKDDTPGCTIQAKEYSAALKDFDKLGVMVFGISGGDEKSKAKFCAKHKLRVTLLSDPDFKVAKAFGSYGPKTFMGKKFNGIFRNTFVIDGMGMITDIFEKVDPEVDTELVLARLKKGSGKLSTTKRVAKMNAAEKRVEKTVGKKVLKKVGAAKSKTGAATPPEVAGKGMKSGKTAKAKVAPPARVMRTTAKRVGKKLVRKPTPKRTGPKRAAVANR